MKLENEERTNENTDTKCAEIVLHTKQINLANGKRAIVQTHKRERKKETDRESVCVCVFAREWEDEIKNLFE